MSPKSKIKISSKKNKKLLISINISCNIYTLTFLGRHYGPRRKEKNMKKDVHPKYYRCKVTCVSCGTTFETGSTAKEIRVDTCSNCHPFYTGKAKLVDTAGRVDKFMNRYAAMKKK